MAMISQEIFSLNITYNTLAREHNETENLIYFFEIFLPFVLFAECLLLWFLPKSWTSHTWNKGDPSKSLLAPAKL